MSVRWFLFVLCGCAAFYANTVTPSVHAAAPPVTALAFCPAGDFLLVGSQAGVELRSWPGLERAAAVQTELVNVHDLAFSPDRHVLAAAGGKPGEDGTVEIFRWPERKLIGRVHPHSDVVYAVAWQSDSAQFATASGDGRVGLCRLADIGAPGALPRRLSTANAQPSNHFLQGHSRGVLAAAFLPGDRLIVTAGIDETIRLWDVEQESCMRTFVNHTRPVLALATRPSPLQSPPNITMNETPPLIASASSDRTVRFWQPTIGRLVRFIRLESAPTAVAWARDGRTLIAACQDGHVRLIDPENATLLKDARAVSGVAYALAIAADGSIAIGGENGEVRRLSLGNN